MRSISGLEVLVAELDAHATALFKLRSDRNGNVWKRQVLTSAINVCFALRGVIEGGAPGSCATSGVHISMDINMMPLDRGRQSGVRNDLSMALRLTYKAMMMSNFQ